MKRLWIYIFCMLIAASQFAFAGNITTPSTYWKLGLKNDPIVIPNASHHQEAIQIVVNKGNIGAYITNKIGDQRKDFLNLGEAYNMFSGLFIVAPGESVILNFDFAFPTGGNGYYQIEEI